MAPQQGRVGKEAKQFAECMALLSTMRRREPLTAADVTVYEHGTIETPIVLLQVSALRLLRAGGWCPDVGEWIGAAEAVRLEQRRAQQYDGCVQCEDSPGWAPRTDRSVARCDCWIRHQDKLTALGLNGPVTLSLPERSSWV